MQKYEKPANYPIFVAGLAAFSIKDSEQGWEKIDGDMRNKLVLGNILDAFGTDLFGTDIERSINGKESIERLSYLSNKRIFDKNFTAEEGKELKNLEQIFSTNIINATNII